MTDQQPPWVEFAHDLQDASQANIVNHEAADGGAATSRPADANRNQQADRTDADEMQARADAETFFVGLVGVIIWIARKPWPVLVALLSLVTAAVAWRDLCSTQSGLVIADLLSLAAATVALFALVTKRTGLAVRLGLVVVAIFSLGFGGWQLRARLVPAKIVFAAAGHRHLGRQVRQSAEAQNETKGAPNGSTSTNSPSPSSTVESGSGQAPTDTVEAPEVPSGGATTGRGAETSTTTPAADAPGLSTPSTPSTTTTIQTAPMQSEVTRARQQPLPTSTATATTPTTATTPATSTTSPADTTPTTPTTSTIPASGGADLQGTTPTSTGNTGAGAPTSTGK